jgi:hypothetical protein
MNKIQKLFNSNLNLIFGSGTFCTPDVMPLSELVCSNDVYHMRKMLILTWDRIYTVHPTYYIPPMCVLHYVTLHCISSKVIIFIRL